MKPNGAHSPLLLRWIQRAARNGSTAEQMAKRFHCEMSFVVDVCKLHGITISGVARPDHVPGKIPATDKSTIGVIVINEHLTVLEREAQRRGTTASMLAGEILNLVAKDNLFVAVLD